MANVSGDSDICSKLKEMTLTDLCDSDESESHDNRNLVYSTWNPDEEFQCKSESCSEFTFDNVIGHLEDMLIDEGFHRLQNSFLEKYWEEFDASEENKHSYMIIFNEYTSKIEDFIVQYLKNRISNFDMEVFAMELGERRDTLDGEIFEVLLTLSDFRAFKEIFLDYRAVKEGHVMDLSSSLSVSSPPFQFGKHADRFQMG